MTCDDFYMNVKSDIVEIIAKDCSVKVEMDVYHEDFVHALLHSNDNLDYLAESVKKELIQRAENAWDESTITDDDLAKFKKVLEWIL